MTGGIPPGIHISAAAETAYSSLYRCVLILQVPIIRHGVSWAIRMPYRLSSFIQLLVLRLQFLA